MKFSMRTCPKAVALWMELHSVVRPVPVRKSHQYPVRWQLQPIAAEQRVRQVIC